jgi:hypothetical protein
MDTGHRDAEALRLVKAFEAIADEQVRQAIIEIVETAAQGDIELNDIEKLSARCIPHSVN